MLSEEVKKVMLHKSTVIQEIWIKKEFDTFVSFQRDFLCVSGLWLYMHCTHDAQLDERSGFFSFPCYGLNCLFTFCMFVNITIFSRGISLKSYFSLKKKKRKPNIWWLAFNSKGNSGSFIKCVWLEWVSWELGLKVFSMTQSMQNWILWK